MMPLDDATHTGEDAVVTPIEEEAADESAPALRGIWSSIGPGRVPDHGEGPPTIRPTDLAATTTTTIGDNPRQIGRAHV